ncbi:hypothetical protein TNCV_731051 [Trichonephila clavipes]|nr:hypothetical protein TNCV_731051 [Trichonephila clavipes]
MVWGGISIGGRTDLHINRNGTLTGRRYADDDLMSSLTLEPRMIMPDRSTKRMEFCALLTWGRLQLPFSAYRPLSSPPHSDAPEDPPCRGGQCMLTVEIHCPPVGVVVRRGGCQLSWSPALLRQADELKLTSPDSGGFNGTVRFEQNPLPGHPFLLLPPEMRKRNNHLPLLGSGVFSVGDDVLIMEREKAPNGLLRGVFFTKEWQHLALFEMGFKKEQTMMRKRCEWGKNILSAKSLNGSPQLGSTPLVLGEKRTAHLIQTPTLYPFTIWRSENRLVTLKLRECVSRQADIPLHSSRLRSTCVRGTQHNGCYSLKLLFYAETKHRLEVG